ncbi:MAG: hypothetical protein B6242_11825 [Anaerolineaceae bacterium 4572_78]|nr:MAG: hypothetical protein B6242_11825 [Anaerolineaceae bacterium 4572_78]
MLSQLVRKHSKIILEPIARFISWTGFSPNFITVIGFLLTVGVAIVLASGYFQIGGILIIIAAAFDALDGTLARMIGRTSKFGAFLDSTLDRFSEAVIFFGILVHLSFLQPYMFETQIQLLLIYATMVGSLMVSYTRARAEGIGISPKDGILTRFERVTLLIIGLVLYPLTNKMSLAVVLCIMAIFTNVTAVQRMLIVRKLTRSDKESQTET